MHAVNFTPGPSQLYFTAQDHVRKAFKEGIPSISHRSKMFESIFESTTGGLRELLNIPSSHYIFFTGSATEIFERIIQNLVGYQSLHLVNGSFSKRFYEVAIQLQKQAEKIEADAGTGFDSLLTVPKGCELIAVTQNETSTGVSLPLDYIYRLKDNYPQTLLAVDAVSSLPYPDLDYTKLDTVFFSVQKGFGLPAGLGVWIVNERCLAKADQLLSEGTSIGSYHNLPGLLSHAKKNQTPETPNVLGIYLLDQIVQDMLRRGIQSIRKETEYKAAVLYQALEQHPKLNPFVKDKKFQSKTVIVADCGAYTQNVNDLLSAEGLLPGDGYGSFKKTQLRFANFPTHSREQFECLADLLQSFEPT